MGDGALYSNIIGGGNNTLGANAGSNLTTGDNNINIGHRVAAFCFTQPLRRHRVPSYHVVVAVESKREESNR